MPHPALAEDVLKTKRIISHRTKQIETRIQRQIVIEDGKVISDSGPQVTTKTLEDSVEKFEEMEETKASSNCKESAARRDHQSCDDSQPTTPRKQYMFGFEAKQHLTDDKHSRDHHSTDSRDSNNSKPTTYFFGQDQSPNKNTFYLGDQRKTNLSKRDINNNDDNMYIDEDGTERDCQFHYQFDNHSKLW